MKKIKLKILIIFVGVWVINNWINAQNPVIHDQFTADPSARVFGDSIYVYPSHDIAGIEGKGRKGWFCMEDYHVFSSANLTTWTDHGTILSQNKVNWVDSNKYSMWAPDCIFKNGKYYFYFPAIAKDTSYGKGFSIGVAISDYLYGPFIPESNPMKNVHGIDPCVFIDKEGKAYLYWAKRNIYMAKLNENMTELASEPQIIGNLPEKGLKEGPFLFERNGIYYLTYPHVQNKSECLEYAMGNSPLGPFKVSGVIMDETNNGCWTNQQSIIKYKGQWYLFYHQNDLSPNFDKNRSIRIDSLFFNNDGTIRKVIPTMRGVGLTDASQQIQIDRYSLKSATGASIAFLDTLNTFIGWKTILDNNGAWLQYNAVDFGSKKWRKVQVKAFSPAGGLLQIRLDKKDGPLLSEVKIPKVKGWQTTDSDVSEFQPGVHNLFLLLKENNPIEIDWIGFIK
jgi:GH43 family beta-xylosidase